MSPNTWITLGAIALAFSAVAIPYGFYLKEAAKKAESATPLVSVVSHGQQNGITTNNVSIENMTIVQDVKNRQGGPNKQTDAQLEPFILADCTFDAILEISPISLQTYRRAFPNENGTLTVIMHIYEGGFADQHARLQLTGDWQGISGMIPRYKEDSIIFTLSEKQFTLLHKKPIIEYVPSTMKHLVIGRQYHIDITAFPGFAVPLIPKQIIIRTHEGVLYPITDFKPQNGGWYTAAFTL